MYKGEELPAVLKNMFWMSTGDSCDVSFSL
jgi:hypothetical protein